MIGSIEGKETPLTSSFSKEKATWRVPAEWKQGSGIYREQVPCIYNEKIKYFFQLQWFATCVVQVNILFQYWNVSTGFLLVILTPLFRLRHIP